MLIKFTLVFLVSFSLTALFVKLHPAVGLVDIPDKRRVHKKITPRAGGIAIYFAILLGVFLFFPTFNQNIIGFVLGATLLVITGLIDDLFDLNAFIKLALQFLSALILVSVGELYFTELFLPFGIHLQFSEFAGQVLSIGWVLFLINAINLIDGLDGLASGFSIIFFVAIAISATLGADSFSFYFSLVMIAATFGFWIWNFPPAKIFLGDTGSMLLGFAIGMVSLLGFKNITFVSVIFPFIILVIPILDVFSAFTRRKINNMSFKDADKKHMHHNILRMFGGNQKKAILYLYTIFILFTGSAIMYKFSPILCISLFVIGIVNFVYIMFKFDMLGLRKKRKQNAKEKKKNQL